MSLSLFWWRLTLGEARVRFRRSEANFFLVAALAAQRPLSWASERARSSDLRLVRFQKERPGLRRA